MNSEKPTILIIDDEQVVRDVAKLMLERQGFTVLAAASGADGVEVYRENAARIDAVLLDMVMPEMDGEEAFARMKAIRSDVKVVLSSGYTEQAASSRFATKGLAGFIQKPFSMQSLGDKFRQVLSQGSSSR